MPDLGPRASRGSTIGTLNLVGGAPIAALEGHWRRIHVRSEDAAKTKGNHGSRQSLLPRIALRLDRPNTNLSD
jgi:hypothetical protein